MGETERRTSITVYAGDLEWMKTRQRRVSEGRDEWITMADLFHELVKAIEKTEAGA
jgi:hypothetical protein